MTSVPDKARLLAGVRRLVVKVGSNVLAGENGLRPARVRGLASDVAALVGAGRQVVIMSSGAVAAGAGRLGPRRKSLEWRQAAAASRGRSLPYSNQWATRKLPSGSPASAACSTKRTAACGPPERAIALACSRSFTRAE